MGVLGVFSGTMGTNSLFLIYINQVPDSATCAMHYALALCWHYLYHYHNKQLKYDSATFSPL